MKTDSYTKAVLTVIAFCLIVIAFKDVKVISTAHAQESSTPVRVDIVSIAGKEFKAFDLIGTSLGPSIPVVISK